MKVYLIRREKYKLIRDKLLRDNVEFLEEFSRFHVIIIPMNPDIDTTGIPGLKRYELMNEEEIRKLEFNAKSFKIDSSKGIIDKFSPYFIEKGKVVNLDNPECTVEIKKWRDRYLVNVS